MIDRRLILNFDWAIFLTALIITSIGIMSIYSAIHADDVLMLLYMKQIYWLVYGLIVMLIVLFVDYHYWAKWAYLGYFFTILLLVFVLMFGKVISGAQRWIVAGSVTFQVSELMKLVLIVSLAEYFAESKTTKLLGFKELAIPAIMLLIPFVLIAKQPDLGTAMLIFITSVVTILIVGINRKCSILFACTTLISIPSAWFFLKGYQKKRILTLINPGIDPLGTGYHTQQSKIAIGSGGLWGKGLFAGTQSRLNFLPERHTDFIFSILSEETGFIGAIILISLYLLLIIKGISIINRCKDKLGVIIAVGIISMFSISTVINLGMTLGLFPVVGVPLPLMSYGGSSLIVNFMAVGLLINVGMRRFKYK